MIKAKRDSDRALAACRNRIAALQTECTKGRDDKGILESAKEALAEEVRRHKIQIAGLEASKADVEGSLDDTRLRLKSLGDSQRVLQQVLHSKNEEIEELEKSSGQRLGVIDALKQEKAALERRLDDGDTRLHTLETQNASLETSLRGLRESWMRAQRQEEDVRQRLVEKDATQADIQKRLDRGSHYIQVLEQKIAGYETTLADNEKKIKVGSDVVSALRDQVHDANSTQKNSQEALVVLRNELSVLQSQLDDESRERGVLAKELDETRVVKSKLEGEIRTLNERCQTENIAQNKLQSELNALYSSYENLETDLESARERVGQFEQVDVQTQTKLRALGQSLHHEMTAKSQLHAELQQLRKKHSTLESSLQAFKEKNCSLERVGSENEARLKSLL